MNEEQWIERAMIAEQKLLDIGQIAAKHHKAYDDEPTVNQVSNMVSDIESADNVAHEIDAAMAFNPANPIDWDFLQRMESTKCGYTVPDGHTYCRNCGGGGGDHYGNECVVCSANGSHQHPSWANRITSTSKESK